MNESTFHQKDKRFKTKPYQAFDKVEASGDGEIDVLSNGLLSPQSD
jgi:hypothetical protein